MMSSSPPSSPSVDMNDPNVNRWMITEMELAMQRLNVSLNEVQRWLTGNEIPSDPKKKTLYECVSNYCKYYNLYNKQQSKTSNNNRKQIPMFIKPESIDLTADDEDGSKVNTRKPNQYEYEQETMNENRSEITANDHTSILSASFGDNNILSQLTSNIASKITSITPSIPLPSIQSIIDDTQCIADTEEQEIPTLSLPNLDDINMNDDDDSIDMNIDSIDTPITTDMMNSDEYSTSNDEESTELIPIRTRKKRKRDNDNNYNNNNMKDRKKQKRGRNKYRSMDIIKTTNDKYKKLKNGNKRNRRKKNKKKKKQKRIKKEEEKEEFEEFEEEEVNNNIDPIKAMKSRGGGGLIKQSKDEHFQVLERTDIENELEYMKWHGIDLAHCYVTRTEKVLKFDALTGSQYETVIVSKGHKCKTINCVYPHLYSQKCHWKRHALTEHCDRKFECQYCGATFRQQTQRKEHVINKHSQTMIKWTCPYGCGGVFSQFRGVVRHVKFDRKCWARNTYYFDKEKIYIDKVKNKWNNDMMKELLKFKTDINTDENNMVSKEMRNAIRKKVEQYYENYNK